MRQTYAFPPQKQARILRFYGLVAHLSNLNLSLGKGLEPSSSLHSLNL